MSELVEVESVEPCSTPILRYRQLHPGPGRRREDVIANQRSRILAAMVELIAEKGYEGTTIKELVKIAGVSKASFYEQFADKEDCFLATYDAALRQAARSALVAVGQADQDRERLRAGILGLAELMAAEQKAVRLVLVDGLAAGPTIRDHVRRRFGLLETMLRDRFASMPGGTALPFPVTRGIVRGIAFVARRLVLEGRVGEFVDFADPLLDWALAFNCAETTSVFSEHDPATRVAPPDGSWHFGKPSAGVGEREMILAATSRLAAEEGFAALTPARICQAGGVSRRRFNASFGDVGDCFLASLEVSLMPLFADAWCAGRTEKDWPSATCAAMRRLGWNFAVAPGLARLAFVEMLAAAPTSLDWSQKQIGNWAGSIYDGVPDGLHPQPMVAAATTAMIWGLMADQVAEGRLRALSAIGDRLAFAALVPVVGAPVARDVLEATRPPS